MPSIRLGRYEVKEYGLPPVCARCGRKAVASPPKSFAWHPPWVTVLILAGLLVYVIVAMVLTKRMTVPLPLCRQHRNYWRNRALLTYGGLAGLVLLGITAVILAIQFDDRHNSDAFGLICVGSVAIGLVWLIALAIVHTISIRPNEITDRSITLVGLSEDFIEAVREERRSDADEEEEDDRPRRRRNRDEDDEERPRRRQARIVDDEDEDDGGYYDPDRRRRRDDEDEDER